MLVVAEIIVLVSTKVAFWIKVLTDSALMDVNVLGSAFVIVALAAASIAVKLSPVTRRLYAAIVFLSLVFVVRLVLPTGVKVTSVKRTLLIPSSAFKMFFKSFSSKALFAVYSWLFLSANLSFQVKAVSNCPSSLTSALIDDKVSVATADAVVIPADVPKDSALVDVVVDLVVDVVLEVIIGGMGVLVVALVDVVVDLVVDVVLEVIIGGIGGLVVALIDVVVPAVVPAVVAVIIVEVSTPLVAFVVSETKLPLDVLDVVASVVAAMLDKVVTPAVALAVPDSIATVLP